jgi:UDP-galactose transporter B1
MARSKPNTPLRHTPSETHAQDSSNGTPRRRRPSVTERIEKRLEDVAEAAARDPLEQKQAGLLALAICVGGIYGAL